MKKRLLVLSAAVLILFSSGLLISRAISKTSDGNNGLLNVWASWSPTTADPLKYDAFIHHIAFRSVLGSLVTQYKVGEFAGMLASSWTISEDERQWTFHLRPGIHFENGAEITPQTVIRSWVRLAYMLRKKGSKSDLFELIEGFDQVSSPADSVSGLKADKSDLVIKLRAPYKKLLETISFGLYAVVYEGDFDQNSGDWKDPHHLTSGNAYRVQEWTDKQLTLAKRDDFLAELSHPRPLKTVRITWDKNNRETADLVIGDSNDHSLPEGQFNFFGGTPASMAYAHCYSWKIPDSPCFGLENRRHLRSLVYQSLQQAGIKPVRSFFPLGMQGISEVGAESNQEDLGNEKKGAGKAEHPVRYYLRRKLGNAYFEAIRDNFAGVANQKGIRAQETELTNEELFASLEPEQTSYKADLGIMASGILIEDPRSDVRFMILTKEGIRLPDADGRIHEEMAKADFSIQKINELLWDQAIIFPIGHFAFGIWAKEKFDMSLLNTIQPPVEFNWIGYKE